MARILAVGNATLDIINLVERYPEEDQEVRALSQHHRRGGNSANTLVVLSQLGHACSWAGTLADEPDAGIISQDLESHGIDLSAVYTCAQGKVPTSYISLSRENGSRTIVHYRDLPEYPASAFTGIDLTPYDWVHFEGRNIDEVHTMLMHLRSKYPTLRCSLEVEKPRPGIENLFSAVDLLMFSRDYVQHSGRRNAPDFLAQLAKKALPADISCTWGVEGAYALARSGEQFHTPAFPPAQVVDTLGAGDTFNAGLIDQYARGASLDTALRSAAKLAGKKCGMHGLHPLNAD